MRIFGDDEDFRRFGRWGRGPSLEGSAEREAGKDGKEELSQAADFWGQNPAGVGGLNRFGTEKTDVERNEKDFGT